MDIRQEIQASRSQQGRPEQERLDQERERLVGLEHKWGKLIQERQKAEEEERQETKERERQEQKRQRPE